MCSLLPQCSEKLRKAMLHTREPHTKKSWPLSKNIIYFFLNRVVKISLSWRKMFDFYWILSIFDDFHWISLDFSEKLLVKCVCGVQISFVMLLPIGIVHWGKYEYKNIELSGKKFKNNKKYQNVGLEGQTLYDLQHATKSLKSLNFIKIIVFEAAGRIRQVRMVRYDVELIWGVLWFFLITIYFVNIKKSRKNCKNVQKIMYPMHTTLDGLQSASKSLKKYNFHQNVPISWYRCSKVSLNDAVWVWNIACPPTCLQIIEITEIWKKSLYKINPNGAVRCGMMLNWSVKIKIRITLKKKLYYMLSIKK